MFNSVNGDWVEILLLALTVRGTPGFGAISAPIQHLYEAAG